MTTRRLPAVEHWSRFLVELARLEHVIARYSTDRESKTSHRGFTTNWHRCSKTSGRHFVLHPRLASALCRFEFPMNDYFTAFRRGQSPEPPEPCTTYLRHKRGAIL